jgi:4-amino-4-deoxy-L-arabinose transferase-like glycosyltransferase
VRRWVSWGGALAAAGAASFRRAAGPPAERLRRVGVVGEALLFPAQDLVAWSLLLLVAAVLLGSRLPGSTVASLRALLLRPSPCLFALGVFAWVFLASSLLAHLVLDGLPSDVDAIARLHQARIFLEGRLFAEAPPEPKAFGVYGLLAWEGRWFSRYEPGPSLVYALSWRTLGTPVFANPLLGGALAAALYALARRAGNEATARVAALLLCLSPFVIGMSGSLQSHPLAALALLSACLFVSLASRNTSPWLAAAGAALALALATRPWTALVAGGVIGGWAVLRVGLRSAPLRLLCLLMGAAPLLALLLAYNRALTGDPLLSPFQAFDPREVPWFGYMEHTPAEGFANTGRLAAVLNLHLFGWPSSLLFLPLAALARPRLGLDRLATAVSLALVTGYFFYYWVDYRFGPRYWYEAAPFLAWLTARGLTGLDSLLERFFSLPASRHRTALAAVALFTAFAALCYAGPLLKLYRSDYGALAPLPAQAVGEAWQGKDALIFVPQWRKRENNGFSSPFLANPVDLAGLSRLDRAAAALGAEASAERVAALARLSPAEAARLREQGRVLFARNLGPDSRARIAAAFPGRRTLMLERDDAGGGITIRRLRSRGGAGGVVLRVPGGAGRT